MTTPSARARAPVRQRAYRAAIASFVDRHASGASRPPSATGPTAPATLLGLGLAASLVGIGFGLVVLGQVPRRRRARRAGARTAVRVDGERAELHEERTPHRHDVRPPPRADGAVRRVARQPAHRLRRAARLARPEAARRAGTHRVAARAAGSSRPTASRSTRRRPAFDQLVTVFPEGAIGRDDSQVVLLRVQPELLTAAHGRRRRGRRMGRVLQDLHPRRLLGGPVRRRQPAARRAAPARVPVPPVGLRPARRRQPGRRPGAALAAPAAASTSTPTATSSPRPTSTARSGPIAWDEG